MARTTIHTLAYKIGMDTTDFQKGVVLSRGETSKLNRTLRDLETPLEKAERDAALLGKAFKAGAIDSQKLDMALDRLQSELNETTTVGGKLSRFLKDRFVVDFSSVLTMVSRAHSAFRTLGNVMSQTFERLDNLAKESRVLGIDPADLERLRVAAARLDGAAPEAAGKALEKMQKSIVDANDGLSTQVRAFERIGITIDELNGKKPLEQLLLISEALSKVDDNNAFVASVKDIFGRGGTDIGNLLRGGTQAFEGSIARLEEAGVFDRLGSLDDIESTLDAIADSKRIWESMLDVLAVRIAPHVENLANTITRLVPSPNDDPVTRDEKIFGGLNQIPGSNLIQTFSGFNLYAQGVAGLMGNRTGGTGQPTEKLWQQIASEQKAQTEQLRAIARSPVAGGL